VKIRPRLLVVSLLVAVAVIGVVVWIQSSGDDDAPVDATLEDPQSVITFPDDGLTNQDVQGDSLPDAVMSDTDGNEVTTADLIGEPLVVNLWNSTCPPCARELPDFAEVDAETDEVRFIGINFLDSIEVMERFAGERGVEYDLLFDEFAEFTDAIGANALPITLFVTSDGTIIQQTGALDADELRAEIANLLAIDEASA
jgi:thiol-disulfide isomerase/thioredoxin